MQEVLEQITVTVVQATSLDQFRNPDGSRTMNMPYFEKGDDHWWWRLVTSDSDAKWLEQKINEGRIYIFKL